MPTYENVAQGARLGELAHAAHEPGALSEALEVVSGAFSGSAVLLTTRRDGEKFSQLAQYGYSGNVADSLCTLFPASPWMALVRDGSLPPSISTEVGQTFRAGWFYEEHLHPAGLRDGMTAAVTHQDRVVGLVHLSSSHEQQFTVRAQRLLLVLLRPLAIMIRSNADLEPDDHADAFTISATGELASTSHDEAPPSWLHSDAFLAPISALLGREPCRLSTLWFTDRQCYRVEITINSAESRSAAHVRSRPIDAPYDLTRREVEVLTRVAVGHSTDTIARALWISPRTVHSHVERILRKTRQSSRLAAASLAIREAVIIAEPQTVLMFVTSGRR
jgi:DNA-binding CsgD family transcriptional regulator